MNGRYPVINATAIDTTDLAAMAAWEVIQGFYSALPQLDGKVQSTEFNLATESYGGHYGPAFFDYFYQQNAAIQNGSASGKYMDFNSLTIINGIIDEYIQAPYYPGGSLLNLCRPAQGILRHVWADNYLNPLHRFIPVRVLTKT